MIRLQAITASLRSLIQQCPIPCHLCRQWTSIGGATWRKHILRKERRPFCAYCDASIQRQTAGFQMWNTMWKTEVKRG